MKFTIFQICQSGVLAAGDAHEKNHGEHFLGIHQQPTGMDISCLSIAFVTCLCHLVFQSFSASKDVFGPINSFYFSVKLEEGMQVAFLSMIPAESSSLTLRLAPSGILDKAVMDASWHSMQLVSNTFLADRQAGSFKSGKKFFIDTMQLSRRGGRSASCLLTPFDQLFSLWLVYV